MIKMFKIYLLNITSLQTFMKNFRKEYFKVAIKYINVDIVGIEYQNRISMIFLYVVGSNSKLAGD